MQVIKSQEPMDPLDAMAAQSAAEGAAADQEQQGPPSQEDQQRDAAMAALEAGAAQVIFGLLKIVRGFIARKLPEIKDEWTDDLLKAPADAAVPLLREHMETAFQVLGANPQLAVLAMASFPLLMGWMAANERHEKNEKRTVEAGPAANDSNGATQG